jgi:hypothetical protein
VAQSVPADSGDICRYSEILDYHNVDQGMPMDGGYAQ